MTLLVTNIIADGKSNSCIEEESRKATLTTLCRRYGHRRKITRNQYTIQNHAIHRDTPRRDVDIRPKRTFALDHFEDPDLRQCWGIGVSYT